MNGSQWVGKDIGVGTYSRLFEAIYIYRILGIFINFLQILVYRYFEVL